MLEIELTTENIAILRFNNKIVSRYRCTEVRIKRPSDLREYSISVNGEGVSISLPEK